MAESEVDIYSNGMYFENNPTWGVEDSPFKAKYIYEILSENKVVFSRVSEIGCGVGGVLRNLRSLVNDQSVTWAGFDISGQAIEIARGFPESHGISFYQENFLEADRPCDVLLVVDVFEHVPDYMGFITECRRKATYKVYHIPLDIHVSATLRDSFLNARKSVGHLHYFSEKTAIATLEDTGHTILATKLTPGAIELFREHPSVRRGIANIPRFIVGLFSKRLSARLFGGYSLLVLAT